jgi:hypothetical protein
MGVSTKGKALQPEPAIRTNLPSVYPFALLPDPPMLAPDDDV